MISHRGERERTDISKTREPFVRLGLGVQLPSILESFGLDSAALITASGLDLKLFDNPKNRVPFRSISRLLARCVEASGCKHLGLLIGQQHNLAYAGAAGFAAMSANTAWDALNTIKEFLVLSDEGGVLTLHKSGEYVEFGYKVLEQNQPGADVIQQMAMAASFTVLKGMFGSGWKPTEIRLSQKQPENRLPFRDFYQAPIRFDTPESAIVFRSSLLEQPLPTANPHLHSWLMSLIIEAKQAIRPDLKQRLKANISLALLDNEASLKDISLRVGLHPRTLNRRLKDQGTSFKEILENVRRDNACKILRNTDMPIAEAASILGYSDSSSFSHAFRRWLGLSPIKWREQNTGQDR